MCYRTANQVKMPISFSGCLMQIVFKVKLSQPYFDCNLGNHSVVKLVSVVKSVMHVWWCPFQVPYMVVCMTQFSSMLLFYLLVKSVSSSGTWTMTVCCSCSTSPTYQFVVSSLQCTILLVVTCTFHLVSLYKVIYHTNLIAQAHSTLLDFCTYYLSFVCTL